MSIRGLPSILGSIVLVILVTARPGTSQVGSSSAPAHPLDGLSGVELTTIAEVLKASGRVDADARYPVVNLLEPPKSEVLNWKAGDSLRREAFVLVKQGARTFEAVVDLSNRAVTSWREIEDAQPNMLEEEIGRGGELVKSHPDWQAAMRRRGITEFDAIICEALTPGYYGIGEESGRRVAKAICFDPRGTKNFWGRPIEGLTTLVDLNTYEVIRVIDTGPVPVPRVPIDYDEAAANPPRELPTSLSMQQPDGPSFRIDGHQVSWQKWGFHFRIDPRVGLVVSRVRYVDGDRDRSILYQGSLSELFVPYMDPDLGWYWRTYMDAGEFLVGINTVPLQPGVDCPENARYFDVAFADGQGRPATRERAACLFERYAGDVAWRHYDFLSQSTEARKKRDLVLRAVATLGNYDYIFDWTFQQDGTIRIAVGASGVDQVKAVVSRTAREAKRVAGGDGGSGFSPTIRDDAYGRFVDEHTVAVNHDHFFSFRLDLDVDGTANSFVREALETVRLAGDHPRSSVWVVHPHVARTEAEGKLRIDLARPAIWRVFHPEVLNPVGYPSSYEIKPGANAYSLLAPEDFPQRRSGFTDYQLWVTPYRPGERYAAGDYPTQSRGGDGLPSWTSANRPIEKTDIVAWYTLGFHHVVRAEDWPVMPTSWGSFELRPFDFFDGNPALDLPTARR